MSGRMELLTAYSSNKSSSLYYWVTLLNLFNEYKDELNVSDMRMLVDECEECRVWFNKNNTDTIEQQDTNPDVYRHLAMLEQQQCIKHKKTHIDEPMSTDMIVLAQ